MSETREFCLFRRDDDRLVPQDVARSLWRDDQMHGVATSAALARALEAAIGEAGRHDLRPARYSVDLFRAPGMSPCTTVATVVRNGPRLALVDATLAQDGVVVARASALFLAPSDDPDGTVWTAPDVPVAPPESVVPVSTEPRVPFFHSDGAGWSQEFAAHQNASRKQTWQVAIPVVGGEETTPFQAVAAIADATSMVVNWGDRGVEFINTDIDLVLSRLPVSVEIGLAARDWFCQDGIAVGSAVVFDRQGPIGTSSVASLANTRRAIDFTEHDFGPEGSSGA